MKIKDIFILLFLAFCGLSFSQNESNRGTIKVVKVPTDTNCTATLLGYSGMNIIGNYEKNVITKKEFLKAEKVELNKNCNCEIISFQLSYAWNNCKFEQDFIGNNFNAVEVFKAIRKSKGKSKITFVLIGKIIIKNKKSGEEIQLPSIIFQITD